MAFTIRRVDYFYAAVEDRPGEAYKLLSQLAEFGINLLAITAVPVGPERTQLTLFPEDALRMASEAQKAGLSLDGPHPALLVQGDDELGALVGIHERLYEARVNVVAASGVTDGRGNYGYVLYFRAEDIDRAAAALEV
ncbi:MAG: hypothetical protein JSV86_04405 [Gemmatimonadota bacterium]|nr:MAG: hypothetical protein JSV86_04405 [Gemmatimonadota bacterium]